ncbi:MAG: aconitate hydratase AcnA [Ectothiorhodospiraceae bacterium]|nr:aconitate hydratase AcnA [Ectothiorhodospiraceae bacterium]
MARLDSLGTRTTLEAGGERYQMFSLERARAAGLDGVERLPYCLKVLLENNLRNEDGRSVGVETLRAFAEWAAAGSNRRDVSYFPARVMMPDSSGIPLLADLAAMRDHVVAQGLSADRLNPVRPFDLVLDHSVTAQFAGTSDAMRRNMELEYARNAERYRMARWAQKAMRNLRVLPPGQGICHQINLEHLSRVVWSEDDAELGRVAFPDTLVGGDSHTPMVNGLGVIGWGVGGIEAASALLGEPVSIVLPDVVGCRLVGTRRPGVTTTDLVLEVTRRLREHGVVQKFVEFTGPAVSSMSLPDRATLANMAPEYGATIGFFPVDEETLRFLRLTARESLVPLVEAYCKAQGLWRDEAASPVYTETLEIDVGEVETSVAGPSRPQQRVHLDQAGVSARAAVRGLKPDADLESEARPRDGDIAIASITSCTNTSNPSVMLAAGLLARNAVRRGLRAKPWVKTSLSPGSRIVADYLDRSGLTQSLDALGFQVVGYGCMTCGSGGGPLSAAVEAALDARGVIVSGVLSSNRNFEGRLHPRIRMTYLASPPLVVAYAIAGSVTADLRRDPLGHDPDGTPVYLADIWPSDEEIRAVEQANLDAEMFRARYAHTDEGGPLWDALPTLESPTYPWDAASTYLCRPPFLDTATPHDPPRDIEGAAILAVLGDHVTTDHISPGGTIPVDSEASRYLQAIGVEPRDFSNYVQRRVNHEVMVRGTFDNPRLRNLVVEARTGAWTRYWPGGEEMTMHEAAERYRADGRAVVVFAGREYGTGSSRDWAAKGTHLLGVSAVIAESFERIHRSNLVGMGVLPVELAPGVTRESLALRGDERVDVVGIDGVSGPGASLSVRITRGDGTVDSHGALCRLDTPREVEWFLAGGIMPFVLGRIAGAAGTQ